MFTLLTVFQQDWRAARIMRSLREFEELVDRRSKYYLQNSGCLFLKYYHDLEWNFEIKQSRIFKELSW